MLAVLVSLTTLLLPLVSSCGGKATKESKDLQGAVITAVAGQVTVIRGDQKFAITQDKLYTKEALMVNGSILETGKDSKADLQFQSGTQMRIGAQSRVKLENAAILTGENFSRTLLRVDSGSLYTKVSKLEKGSSFSVVTPTATAAVRGTDFLTKVDAKTSNVLVQEGSVAVTDPSFKEEKVVEGGNKAAVSGESVDVKPLDEKDKKELTDFSTNLQSITEQGRSQIDSILQNFEENKKQIQQALDDQKAANKQLIEGQKENNRQVIEAQLEKNRQMMQSRTDEDRKAKEALQQAGKEEVRKSAEQGRSDIDKQKKTSDLDRIKSQKPGQ